jgi:hypothetical protein
VDLHSGDYLGNDTWVFAMTFNCADVAIKPFNLVMQNYLWEGMRSNSHATKNLSLELDNCSNRRENHIQSHACTALDPILGHLGPPDS